MRGRSKPVSNLRESHLRMEICDGNNFKEVI